MPETGGLKGKTAPGDAHPYLALFYCLKLGVYTSLLKFIRNKIVDHFFS